MFTFALVLVCIFIYCTIASIIGQTGYKIARSKCRENNHSDCEHGGWYITGAIWPVAGVAFLAFLAVYVVLAGPLRIGDWVSGAASKWGVFNG